jgi:hypothetical protein
MVVRNILTLFENFSPPFPEKEVRNGNTNADQSAAGQRSPFTCHNRFSYSLQTPPKNIKKIC